MKKTVAILTALTAVLGASSAAFAAEYSFSDISDSRYSWCAPQIEDMYEAGYVNGYDDDTYRPDNQVTKLEGIALFSRMMGSNNEANEDILELAHEGYDESISTCGLSWGQDELVYLMYKGAFTNADLTTYIVGKTKDQPMTRGEAAVIITKAMGGEKKLASSASVELDYTDADSIASNILPYVDYVTEQGIMTGMDDGSFSASGTVTRAQIAVMLSRVDERCDYSFDTVRISAIDTDAETVTLLGSDSEETVYDYTADTNFYITGEIMDIEDIPENVAAVAQFSAGELVSLDAMSDQPDDEIIGVFSGYNTVSGIIQVKIKEDGSSTVTTYTCIEDVPITYQGSPAAIQSFKSGDSVVLELSGGKVQSIRGEEKSITISNATVTALDIGDTELTMTISSADSDYDGKTYPVADNVRVEKNNKSADMASIYVGDRVKLTIEYGEIVDVEATASTTTVSGTLKSLTIANQPSLTVTVEGKDQTYQIPQDCIITINEEEGTLYDFRVGDGLVLTVESDAVTRIRCSTSVITTTGRVYGTVTAVNSSYGFISVMTEDSDIPVTIFCRDNTTTMIDETGGRLEMSDIDIGDVIECRGTTTNGAFVATLMIVTPASE